MAVKLLLERNAALDAKTGAGETPLDVAKNSAVRSLLQSEAIARAGGAAMTKARAGGAAMTKAATPLRARHVASKASKKGKAMKLKVMKVMKRKIASGKHAKARVWKGRFEKTAGGLTKDHLTKSKAGKIVSKKRQLLGHKAYGNLKGWVEAFKKARAQLGVTGFVVLKTGSPLYLATKELYQA